jgi:hypothetical protein
MEEDPQAAAEALQQLVDLGYIAPLSPNQEENVNRTIRDTKFFKIKIIN